MASKGPSTLQVVVTICGAVAGGWLGNALRVQYSASREVRCVEYCDTSHWLLPLVSIIALLSILSRLPRLQVRLEEKVAARVTELRGTETWTDNSDVAASESEAGGDDSRQ